ncbi:hypothetical protein L596_024402 [Steinernema carpocapsae]|uniref:Uncharacterized protein n=1 Tax=Steinernema carpocapsae TaxID=34508 RepID=A0A4U5MHD0_STECR|nr:hypothetical protein L596_024402 [Steinernema carpocapsae]
MTSIFDMEFSDEDEDLRDLVVKDLPPSSPEVPQPMGKKKQPRQEQKTVVNQLNEEQKNKVRGDYRENLDDPDGVAPACFRFSTITSHTFTEAALVDVEEYRSACEKLTRNSVYTRTYWPWYVSGKTEAKQYWAVMDSMRNEDALKRGLFFRNHMPHTLESGNHFVVKLDSTELAMNDDKDKIMQGLKIYKAARDIHCYKVNKKEDMEYCEYIDDPMDEPLSVYIVPKPVTLFDGEEEKYHGWYGSISSLIQTVALNDLQGLQSRFDEFANSINIDSEKEKSKLRNVFACVAAERIYTMAKFNGNKSRAELSNLYKLIASILGASVPTGNPADDGSTIYALRTYALAFAVLPDDDSRITVLVELYTSMFRNLSLQLNLDIGFMTNHLVDLAKTTVRKIPHKRLGCTSHFYAFIAFAIAYAAEGGQSGIAKAEEQMSELDPAVKNNIAFNEMRLYFLWNREITHFEKYLCEQLRKETVAALDKYSLEPFLPSSMLKWIVSHGPHPGQNMEDVVHPMNLLDTLTIMAEVKNRARKKQKS